MEPVTPITDRESRTPFLLKVFYRTGAFHRPDEFAFPDALPPHLPLYAWPNCTLAELSQQIAAATPSVLPDPAIGTRLSFRLFYPDTRATPAAAGGRGHHQAQPASNGPARFVVKDLGTTVIGEGGPGADTASSGAAAAGGEEDVEEGAAAAATPPPPPAAATASDALRTLGEAKYVVGDFLSCAILPPLASGEVAPPTAARTGRGAGAGEARSVMGVAPPAPGRDGGAPGYGRGAGGGRGRGAGRRGGGGGGFGGAPRDREWDRDRDGVAGGGIPSGDWRRGERLPDAPPMRGRGRGWDRDRDRERERDRGARW